MAEDGSRAWLRYAPINTEGYNTLEVPSTIVALNSTKSSPVFTAGQELQKGINSILAKNVKVLSTGLSNSSAIIVGTIDAYTAAYGNLTDTESVEDDGFLLHSALDKVVILGRNERGALYGAFEYLSQLARNNLTDGVHVSNPQVPIRWTNEWDNMDGSIERGYGGASNYFKGGYVVENVTRAAEYARLLASVGINGVIVNNVNANATLLSDRNVEGLGRLADAMRPYGVQLGISLNFASPQAALGTFDPLDPKVDAWWANITNQIYKKVPDMAGFLVKANSEGQPGPLTYNRTLADGANMFARAVKPHGGVVMRALLRHMGVGLVLGTVTGIVARGFMALLTEDPHFSWAGTGFIVGVFAVSGLSMAAAYHLRTRRRSRWWKLLALPTVVIGFGPGMLMVPGIVGMALAASRRR